MVLFWVPEILGAVLYYIIDAKRDRNFDNYPYMFNQPGPTGQKHRGQIIAGCKPQPLPLS